MTTYSFEDDFQRWMRDPEFAAAYREACARNAARADGSFYAKYSNAAHMDEFYIAAIAGRDYEFEFVTASGEVYAA